MLAPVRKYFVVIDRDAAHPA
ncbi:hypothetical protein CNECB9_1220005 [Cupriavidus necator]|uniref:Uncharacterized protein n=1 Tax=Cupriavidus necator TaxID=106590 RepID=A0A1K0JE64_CUPNE|nr:hypothetical protein CNECB9_1220005 [Cupriavidus necator]